MNELNFRVMKGTELVGKTGQIRCENNSLIDYISVKLKHTVSTAKSGTHWVDIGHWDQESKLNLTTEKAFEVKNQKYFTPGWRVPNVIHILKVRTAKENR